MEQLSNHSGLNMNSVNLKSSLEDFLKIEYTEGFRNEFATMDALLNSLSKDTITGKKKYKSFALGIVDNIRAIGNGDLYSIGLSDFNKSANIVDAEFDTTKLLGVFSITDETMLKGSTDGSLFDVLAESLNRMQIGLKHTMNRYTYGSKTGLIGRVHSVAAFADAAGANPGIQCGGTTITQDMVEFECENTLCLLPGMGIMLRAKVSASGDYKYRQGYIFQKDDSELKTQKIIAVLDDDSTGLTKAEILKASLDTPSYTSGSEKYTVELYARQLNKGPAVHEYTGLQDIVCTQNNNIFGVNRSVYKQLNCIHGDLDGEILTESALRDMADKISLVTPEGANINLVCAKHSIISILEKQMYMFKQYSMDGAQNGFTLGRPNIRFDTYELKKDKYAHDKTVYLLDTTKIGELLRKDFGWITSGRETILERRDGTEVYEAIMTKYADMYIDAWKAHACFLNVQDDIGSADTLSKRVQIVETVNVNNNNSNQGSGSQSTGG